MAFTLTLSPGPSVFCLPGGGPGAHLIASSCPPPRFDVRKEKRRINGGLGHLSRTHQSTKTFGTQTCRLPNPSRSPTPPSVSLREARVQGAVLEELSLRFA
ncbi:unnamed protein product [Gadus morhua 'NCC']